MCFLKVTTVTSWKKRKFFLLKFDFGGGVGEEYLCFQLLRRDFFRHHLFKWSLKWVDFKIVFCSQIMSLKVRKRIHEIKSLGKILKSQTILNISLWKQTFIRSLLSGFFFFLSSSLFISLIIFSATCVSISILSFLASVFHFSLISTRDLWPILCVWRKTGIKVDIISVPSPNCINSNF